MKKKPFKKHKPDHESKPKKATTFDLPQAVLQFFRRQPAQRFTAKQLANRLQIKDIKSKNQLMSLLEALAEQGKLAKPTTRHFTLGPKGAPSGREAGEVVGTVDYVNPNFAFVVPELPEDEDGEVKPMADVRVASRNLMGALHGDKVRVRVMSTHGRNPEGAVTAILAPGERRFVGLVEVLPKYAFVTPASKKMHFDIFVPLEALNGAKRGQKVVVEVDPPQPRDKHLSGRITQVLGEPGEHDAEIHAIMFEFGLPFEFPEGLEEIAQQIPDGITPEEVAKRRDCRGITTFTIDPLTAKDFDDAISIRKTERGTWEIGVHIADVTHYVTPGTPVEIEARKRATSVYLVDRTIPMLPERLSNELCSLRPHEDKLTFSAIFELDAEARLLGEWFGRTVIHSDRRFTYEEAQERIETGQGDFASEIVLLNDLAKKMKAERFRQGAIGFETVEFVFQLAEDGRTPLGMVVKERKDAHKLVEEFMLLANKRVATYVHELRKQEPRNTMVYRIHEPPDPDKVSEFAALAKRFGYTLDIRPEKLPFSLNGLSELLQGKPEQQVLETQAIRTMSKAKYTTQAIGHYGLGFAHYTHFTSPIRRYPDMLAHRLLQHYLDDGKSAKKGDLEEACKHSSAMEKRASDAERASVKYKQVEYMKQFVGTQLEGMIIGMTDWGMFIELTDTRCEGMARLSDIVGDYYQFDPERQRVVGHNTGRIFELGSRVRVLVAAARPERRELDLQLV